MVEQFKDKIVQIESNVKEIGERVVTTEIQELPRVLSQ